MPRPLQGDLNLLTLKVVSESRVTMVYLCAKFSLPRPLCSRLRPCVRDRQTDVRQPHFLMPPPIRGGAQRRWLLGSSHMSHVWQRETTFCTAIKLAWDDKFYRVKTTPTPWPKQYCDVNADTRFVLVVANLLVIFSIAIFMLTSATAAR